MASLRIFSCLIGMIFMMAILWIFIALNKPLLKSNLVSISLNPARKSYQENLNQSVPNLGFTSQLVSSPKVSTRFQKISRQKDPTERTVSLLNSYALDVTRKAVRTGQAKCSLYSYSFLDLKTC